MSDAELAATVGRSVLDHTLDEWERRKVVREIKALLDRIRLDEARWWAEHCHQEDETGHYYHLQERIRTLEQQAAGGSAAGSQK